jgi:hypothetical protein
MSDPLLSSWHVAHPPDWKIEGRRLILYPMLGFLGRGAEFLGRRTAREISVCARHGTLADKGGDKFIGATRLDPGEKAASWFHEGEILNHQLRASLGIDLVRSCLATVTQLARCAAA